MKVIKVENLSKAYRIGLKEQKSDTLGGSLINFIKKPVNNFKKLKSLSSISENSKEEDVFWALKDINFEVEQGEILGIIGKNGAGKSTLLKILSRITEPTTGRIEINGRVASLLEVGTGFNPELTGRENTYLNGTILGMTKKEIDKKFDEIVDFSGVEKFIDTPVKRYSSGMRVRLAFAVAAFLEPEILIIDEVLAVGDAEFQKKCLGKMQDISHGEGKSVLFVSHNMAAIRSLCTRALVLNKSKLIFNKNPIESVNYYLSGEINLRNNRKFNNENDWITLEEIEITAFNKTIYDPIDEYDQINLRTAIIIKKQPEKLHLTYVLKNNEGIPLFTITTAELKNLILGRNNLICHIPKGFLNVSMYFLDLYIIKDSKYTVYQEIDLFGFNVVEGERKIGSWMNLEPGFIKPKFKWTSI